MCKLTSGRGDGHKACHHALYSADDGGFPEHEHIQSSPRQEARRGAHMSVEHGQPGDDVGTEGRTAIEPRPPHPQQPRARKHEQHIVRRKPLPILRQPRPNLHQLKTLSTSQNSQPQSSRIRKARFSTCIAKKRSEQHCQRNEQHPQSKPQSSRIRKASLHCQEMSNIPKANLKAHESEKQASPPALPRRGASSIAKEMSNIPKANLKAHESEKQACIAKK
jgi:hypothetical protein